MTDSDAVLIFLSLATVLNLALLLRVGGKGSFGSAHGIELMLPIGVEVESFTGMSRRGEQVGISPANMSAYAFIFLSKGCPKCRAATPAVMEVARRAVGRGVEVWIITAEDLTPADLGQSDDCEDYFLDVPRTTHAMLNPRRASPAYLFIGADMTAQAGGFVGDEDWLAFAAQLAPST